MFITNPVYMSPAMQGYKETALRALKISFPQVQDGALINAINWSIENNFRDTSAVVKNNYKHTEQETTLFELTNYILSKKPIITPSGVMFSQHGTVPNPIVRMVERFLEGRDEQKKLMFKYPKGTEMYEHYNLMQLLAKLDANGTYGVIGARSSIFFNLYVAQSVTHQGFSAISAAALLFESFLSDNVGFSSLNDLVTFITNVVHEERHWNSTQVLDIDNVFIDRESCFLKLILGCKFGYIPDKDDMNIIWEMLQNLSNDDITRLYYKNNLYSFVENAFPMNCIINMLKKLFLPYINPNKVPDVIKDDLANFWDLLKEYVYYDKQIIDRLGKMDNIIRNVSIVMDTDSSIVSVDAWYRCILNHTYNIDMNIKHHICNPFIEYKYDEFGDRIDLENPFVQEVEPPLDYDFYRDSVIEAQASVNKDEIVPQDGLRYSIINILAYCMTQMINDFMYKYVVNANSLHPTKGCLFIMKNEFLFKRVLDSDGKKNYASIQELQEGNIVPKEKQLDIKGLNIKKSGTQEIRDRLQKILYEDILNAAKVDQLNILKKLALTENEIYNNILSGDKRYYKPQRIKAASSYDDPMGIQGVRGAYVYNALKDPSEAPIDLTVRNTVIIVKCNITPKEIVKIADKYPDIYAKLIELFKTDKFAKDGKITAIAIPMDAKVPEWLLDFVDYQSIIHDNICSFPLESVGLSTTPNKAVNYTNMLSI